MKNDPIVVNPPQPFLRCHGTRMVPFFQLLPEPFVGELHLAVAEGRGILHGKRGTEDVPGNKTGQKVYLVGGIPTPLKNMKVNWDDYFQYMEK